MAGREDQGETHAAPSVRSCVFNQCFEMNLGRTLAGEPASLAARFSSAFNNVLVTFYVLWFIELFSSTFIAPMRICLANSRLAVRRILEDGLLGFAFGTRYDKVPLEGLTSR